MLYWQVNPSVVEQLESGGMLFVGHDDDRKRMEIMELQGPFSTCLLHLSFCVFRADHTRTYIDLTAIFHMKPKHIVG